MRNNIVSGFIIGTFVTLYLMVSLISTIHVVEFFRLSNPEWLAISLAIAFEVGAAASLASIIALKKMNQGLVWMLFIILTLMQAMGNTYYAFTHLENFSGWVELFDMVGEDILYQKRILSIISGAILPLVALGFIKSLVDYIKPENKDIDEEDDNISDETIKEDDKYTNSKREDEILSEPSIIPTEGLDGGSSSFIHENNADEGHVMSPEHFSEIPNANANKNFGGNDLVKRYPENLE